MGLFNRDNKNNVTVLTSEQNTNLKNAVALKQEFEDYKVNKDNEILEINKRIKALQDLLYNKTNVLELIKTDIKKEPLIDYKYIAKNANIPNLNPTNLKFYLFENGILDMKINKIRNVFKLKNEKNIFVPEKLKDCIIIKDNEIVFTEKFIDYIKSNKKELIDSINKYDNKKKEYEISKNNLGNIAVKNYQMEIGRICGTQDGYNSDKWKQIYDIFRETYSNFEQDYKRYNENEMMNENAKYAMSKVKYVVTVMHEGDFLLKIACDLFVN